MSLYVIGDLHGCLAPLENLLRKIHFSTKSDRLWFVGDLINRGPNSLEVLLYLNELHQKGLATIVLGNHDLHLIRCTDPALNIKVPNSFESIFKSSNSEKLIDWLRKQPLLHQENQYILTHAGLSPQWRLSDAIFLANKLQEKMSSKHYLNHLRRLWQDEPTNWKPSLSKQQQLTHGLNAFTRIRYVSEKGHLVLQGSDAKLSPDKAPKSYIPWFKHPKIKKQLHGYTILFGHWSTLGVMETKHAICLDSGCAWGGSLTALRLEDRARFQVPNS